MVIRFALGLPNEPISDAEVLAIARISHDFPNWITEDTPIRRSIRDHGAGLMCVWSYDDVAPP
jgi:hypothetical protein